MSLSCPVDLDVLRLRREVTAMYGSVAAAPDGTFHFHRGPEYAARTLATTPTRSLDCPST
jgi:arsenite methyltransferase